MDERRYVVEITRSVAPEKVEQVAERIAARLNVPRDRIVTLLEGRTGAVTKPVLPSKADAIAEVFAEAGVRVVVAAAPTETPPYREEFGQPAGAAAGEARGEAGDAHDAHGAGQDDDPPGARDDDPARVEEADDPAWAEETAEEDVPPWSEGVAWGFGADDADDADAADGEAHADQSDYADDVEVADDESDAADAADIHDAAGAPYAAGTSGAADVPDAADAPLAHPDPDEEEADRLGPAPRRLRVAYGDDPASGAPRPYSASSSAFPDDYASATSWTPSPHDPYAFAPEDAAGVGDRRPSPVGRARATPLSSAGEGRDHDERAADSGFFSPPDYDAPREGPRLRSYLLWALGLSLLVLILLQFVLASRADAAPVPGDFAAGMTAYRKGDFGAARRAWEPLALAGDAQAQYLLGFMAQNGLGQPWTNAGAATWYRQAAHQGLPQAQLALGDLYLRGMGVEQDLRMGATWYASAAVAGDPAGQFEYARLLLHGVGVEQDLGAAHAWFEAAAANGVAEAADYVAYARH